VLPLTIEHAEMLLDEVRKANHSVMVTFPKDTKWLPFISILIH
jgi:hypothetical protein